MTNQWNFQNFRPHYNLNLQSISVNGQPLAIDPSVFATASNKGTIVDTGTTLAYLTEDAYDPLVNAVSYSEEILTFLFVHLSSKKNILNLISYYGHFMLVNFF